MLFENPLGSADSEVMMIKNRGATNLLCLGGGQLLAWANGVFMTLAISKGQTTPFLLILIFPPDHHHYHSRSKDTGDDAPSV